MAQDLEHPEARVDDDFMPLLGIDHVEFYVGNARQAAFYYSKAFGFNVTAYAGPETKVRDRASCGLGHGGGRTPPARSNRPRRAGQRRCSSRPSWRTITARWCTRPSPPTETRCIRSS